MGVFGLSSRGLSPLGQVETGLIVPVIGARETTFLGRTLVLCASLLTVWRVPAVYRFRTKTQAAAEIVGRNKRESQFAKSFSRRQLLGRGNF